MVLRWLRTVHRALAIDPNPGPTVDIPSYLRGSLGNIYSFHLQGAECQDYLRAAILSRSLRVNLMAWNRISYPELVRFNSR